MLRGVSFLLKELIFQEARSCEAISDNQTTLTNEAKSYQK
jgi:hypothetical protein